MSTSIWFDPSITIERLYESFPQKKHLATHVGLEVVEIGPDFIRGTLPVDDRTRQVFGILHGGASCVLSESLGSIAACLVLNPEDSVAVGVEINANHLRSVGQGLVTGHCKPLHIGRTIQVWQTDIFDDRGRMTCTSRLTTAVVDRKRALSS